MLQAVVEPSGLEPLGSHAMLASCCSCFSLLIVPLAGTHHSVSTVRRCQCYSCRQVPDVGMFRGLETEELCKEGTFEENIKELGQRGRKTSLPGKESQFKGPKVY